MVPDKLLQLHPRPLPGSPINDVPVTKAGRNDGNWNPRDTFHFVNEIYRAGSKLLKPARVSIARVDVVRKSQSYIGRPIEEGRSVQKIPMKLSYPARSVSR